MNELYAADPAVCGHSSELKLLLAAFGPYTGRYLANYPTDWSAHVERQFDNIGEIEAARVRTLLRRAKETSTLITRNNLPWDPGKDWLRNAEPILESTPSVFHGLVATHGKPPAIHPLDELDLPPTAEERIAGTPHEYARISKILLLISPELVFVDPYLNPIRRPYATVLKTLFALAAKGKSQKISLWARESLVFGNSNPSAIKADLSAALRQLAVDAAFKPGFEIEMFFVEDETRQAKMHGRYLLSIKGGVRLDQGYQQLPQDREVDVGPVGKATHDALLDIYFEGRHDMQIVEHLSFKT